MFPHMDDYEFAHFFVSVKRKEISRALRIKILYAVKAEQTVCKFVKDNKKSIRAKFDNEYDTLFDEKFFNDVINALRAARKRGVPLKIDMPMPPMPKAPRYKFILK